MSFFDRITLALAGPQGQALEFLTAALPDATARARALEAYAPLAPRAQISEELEALAADAQSEVTRIADALRAGGKPAKEPKRTAIAFPNSHWARLVQSLDRHRDASLRYLEHAARLSADLPETARFLEELARDCERRMRALRAMIARADPQSAD